MNIDELARKGIGHSLANQLMKCTQSDVNLRFLLVHWVILMKIQ
jgi:hypothetical protein